MFTVITCMLGGMLLGLLLRRRRLSGVQHAITALIWLLLFLLGVEVGGNRRIVEGLATLGLEAAVLTVAGLAGSCLTAWALWAWLYRRRKAV